MKRNGEHPFGHLGQISLLVVFLFIWILDSFFLHLSTFLSNYVPLYIRLVFLSLSLITAGYLFRKGHVVINYDQRFSGVISTGIFQYVRHPVYLASILNYFAVTFSTLSLFSFAILVLIFIFYNYIASYEEKLMETKFGEDYRIYKKKTGKWVPKFTKPNSQRI